MSGGGPRSYQYNGPDIGSEVVTLDLVGGGFVVVGGLVSGADSLISSDSGKRQGGGDRDAATDGTQYAIAKSGASIIIDKDGSVNISAGPGSVVNIQGSVRMSSDGAAGDYAVSASGLTHELGRLWDIVNELNRRLSVHEATPIPMTHLGLPATFDPTSVLSAIVPESEDPGKYTILSIRVPSAE